MDRFGRVSEKHATHPGTPLPLWARKSLRNKDLFLTVAQIFHSKGVKRKIFRTKELLRILRIMFSMSYGNYILIIL